MRFSIHSRYRRPTVIVHDLVMTWLAVVAAFWLRFGDDVFTDKPRVILFSIATIVAVGAMVVYHYFSLYRSIWRFASTQDLINILRAVTVVALLIIIGDFFAARFYHDRLIVSRATAIIYWFVQISLLGGPRLLYRYYRDWHHERRVERKGHRVPALVLGSGADADLAVRMLQSDGRHTFFPAGVLSNKPSDEGQSIRGVRVLGRIDELEAVCTRLGAQGIKVRRLLLTPSALDRSSAPEDIITTARRLDIVASRVQRISDIGHGGAAVAMQPISIGDLLLRPSVDIDETLLTEFICGKRIVVTGGGGSIGSEICRRVAKYGASDLLILDNSEPALHDVAFSLDFMDVATKCSGRICDIRDRQRTEKLICDFRPDLVFHAAALKHVPYLERDWDEGVRTNVIGTMNVADATVKAGARAMVLISTDKAIRPVSVLGATKRFAELYCQALDLELANGAGDTPPPRILAVRFGNVLGSSGSVVPRFRAQIERGGPVTVTHPDMVRYFMTVREAVDLVLTASAHGAGTQSRDVCVYALNMGEQVHILRLAETMIRLSGYEPYTEVPIEFTGSRPGERLQEELFSPNEPMVDVGVRGMLGAKPDFLTMDEVKKALAEIDGAVASGDQAHLHVVLKRNVRDYLTDATD
ncbi:MAG: nucleoside-diphosphate sugar epimerase/dehydratase [Hyphomicrobiales bacterium]